MAQYAEHWGELLFNLDHLTKRNAKRQWRYEIRWSWGGLCAYCRNKKATSLDHVQPRSRGGSSLRSNLVPCCVDCQKSKGNRTDWYDWFKEQPFFNQDAADLITEWTTNKRFLNHDHERLDDRATICIKQSTLRNGEDEPPCSGIDSTSLIEESDGAEKRDSTDSDAERYCLQG